MSGKPDIHESKKDTFEHTELPAKLLDYFLRSNKSNINQYTTYMAYTTYMFNNTNMCINNIYICYPTLCGCGFVHIRVHVSTFVFVYVCVSVCVRTRTGACAVYNKRVSQQEQLTNIWLHHWCVSLESRSQPRRGSWLDPRQYPGRVTLQITSW